MLELNSGVTTKVEAIASHGLGPDADAAAPIMISDSEADLFIDALKEHRLAGAAVVCLIDGGISASSEVANRIVSLHDDEMGRTMRSEIMALRVSGTLTDAGVEHRLLQGAALAHTVYSDPAARSFRIVDVLIPSRSMYRAVDLLVAEGATRAKPELRAGYDQRFADSVTLRLNGRQIALHRVFCPGPFGVWMKPNDLFVLRGVLDIANVDIPILDATDNLLHGCYYLALAQIEPALTNVRDVALLAGTTENLGFDAGRFDQTVDRWRGRAVIRRAVRIVERRLGFALPSELSWYGKASVEKADLAAMEPYLVERERGRIDALAPATFRALSMSDRAAYALAVGLPDGTEPVSRIKEIFKRR